MAEETVEVATPEVEQPTETEPTITEPVEEQGEETEQTTPPATEQVVETKTEPVVAIAPTAQTPPAVPPPIAQPAKVDWKTELKKADRNEALKELGLDQFEIDLINYRKETGDIIPYLEAKAIDYTKVTDAEILRRSLRNQYKELDDEEFDLLYQDEIADKYKLDPEIYDAQAQRLGKLKMKVDAERVRKAFIADQQKFTIPVRQKEVVQPPEDNTAKIAEMQQAWEQEVQANDATKKLLTDKRLVLGGKESPFNFEVDDPAEAIASAVDNQKFWTLFQGADGTDFGKFFKVREYAKNPDKFEKTLIDYGKSLGRKAEVDELKNPRKIEPGATHEETTGDFYADIGKAFITRGRHTKAS